MAKQVYTASDGNRYKVNSQAEAEAQAQKLAKENTKSKSGSTAPNISLGSTFFDADGTEPVTTTEQRFKGNTLLSTKDVPYTGSAKSAPALIFPPVVSSKAAKTHIDTKVKPTLDEAKKGIENQRMLLDQQRQADIEAQKVSESTQLDNQTRQAKLEEIKQKALLIQKELNSQDEGNSVAEGSGTIADTSAPTGEVTPPKDPYDVMGATAGAQAELDRVSEAYYKEAENVSKTIKKISSGSIPLTTGEQAQVDGLKQQYQQLIDEQQQMNAGAQGMANVRGYQTGAGEYDANFQVKTIGAIVNKGLNNVADLNTKMASAVADLESSFKADKISEVQASFAAYEKAAEKRQAALQSTIDNTTKAIQEARKAQEEAQKTYYDQVTKPINDLIKDAAKGGASGAVIATMQNSPDVASAAAAASNYLQTGEYAEMVQAFRSAGMQPPSVADFYAKKLGTDTSGFGGEVPFQATIEGAAALAGSVTGEASAAKQMAELAKNGDYNSLLTRMESLARKGMGAEQGKEVFTAQNQVKSITDLQKVLDEYEALGGQIGPLPATSKALTAKLGQLSGDPRYASLATRMTAAFQKYRQEMSGAAFGVQESAEYKKVVPTGDKSFELNRATINGLKEFLNNNVNNAYDTQLGEGYLNLKDYVVNGKTSTGSYLLKTEQDAQNKVRELGTSDPAFKAQVNEILTNDPDLTFYDILELMNIPVSTGNVSMGNVPQRNNNPGNVKAGGLADQYAAKNPDGSPKTDGQGHLIFPDANAGTLALKADIGAKISGNSPAAERKLGKQAETLAELNQVYAEDPNWKNNVARTLGVSPNARLSSIPREELINAIMQAEGYYA